MLAGGSTLQLFRRGDEYSIMAGANELMNSRKVGSERALAQIVHARIARDRIAGPVLIGGLGMGFTLRAWLAASGSGEGEPSAPSSSPGTDPSDRIIVAELVPQVIDWARGPLAGLFAGSLDDRRVDLVVGDVAGLIAADRRFAAILLDVDNGPAALTQQGNARLYAEAGLAAAKAALVPGGVLAIWSAAPDRGFTRRLGVQGFAVEQFVVRAGRDGRGARQLIWLATRPA